MAIVLNLSQQVYLIYYAFVREGGGHFFIHIAVHREPLNVKGG